LVEAGSPIVIEMKELILKGIERRGEVRGGVEWEREEEEML
jgi:hypothetical protein